MEPPFLVFRDRTSSGSEVITTVPIDELFRMQEYARQLTMAVAKGEQGAAQAAEMVFQMALQGDPKDRGKAVVSAFLLRESMRKYKEHQETQKAQQQNAPMQPQGGQPSGMPPPAPQTSVGAPPPPPPAYRPGAGPPSPADYAAAAHASMQRARAEKQAREAAAAAAAQNVIPTQDTEKGAQS